MQAASASAGCRTSRLLGKLTPTPEGFTRLIGMMPNAIWHGYTGRRTAGSAAHTALHFTMCRDGALSCSGITAPGASSVLTIATKGGERYDPPRLGAGSGNQLYSSQHSGRDHQTLVKKEQCKSILSISRNALRGRHCEMTYTV